MVSKLYTIIHEDNVSVNCRHRIDKNHPNNVYFCLKVWKCE